MRDSDTICALATPAGEGAIAILRLSGDAALGLLQQSSRRKSFEPRRLCYARLRDPQSGETLDRALVCFMPGPHSYTGEDVVEVHAHGGELNAQRLLSLFLGMGARHAEPGEFTRRAFLRGRLDLSQAEGVAQLVAARSERSLRNAHALLDGQLGVQIRALRTRVLELAANLEACLDFNESVEGEIPVFSRMAEAHLELEREIARLASTHSLAQRLDGASVGLVGPVNVGKSSLFNRLVCSTRALVSEEPGTTRDYLEETRVWRGIRLKLIDTAGWRPLSETPLLERQGLALVEPVLRRCDLILSVVDLSDSDPASQAHHDSDVQVLIVANKADLAAPGALERLKERLGRPVVATSALTGEGIDELRARMESLLLPSGGESETVLVAGARQWDALRRAGRALAQGREVLQSGLPPEIVVEHGREALQALGEITGESFTEELLDTIFRDFCIGK